MFSFQATEMKFTTSSPFSLENTGYQNYYEALIEKQANFTKKEAEALAVVESLYLPSIRGFDAQVYIMDHLVFRYLEIWEEEELSTNSKLLYSFWRVIYQNQNSKELAKAVLQWQVLTEGNKDAGKFGSTFFSILNSICLHQEHVSSFGRLF